MIGKGRRPRGAKGGAQGTASAVAVAACLLLAGPAHADILTVNSAGDTGDLLPGNGQCRTGGGPPLVGECTLRAAIEEANANDNVVGGVVDEVRFAIPGPGPHTIAPALPFVTEPLVIDGYTQGDATATPADDATENTLPVGDNADGRVRLDGAFAPGLPAGIGISAAGSVVRGLSITRFAEGVVLAGSAADGNTVAGNLVGDDDFGEGSDNAGNVIAFNGSEGIGVSGQGSTSNVILGNSIFSNARLGISLGANPNDGVGDPDSGPNNPQNSPVILSAKTGRRSTTIRGTLEGVRTGAFIVQYFAGPKGTREEGKTLLGTQGALDSDGDGVNPLIFHPERKVEPGLFVTATATRVATGDTLTFSAPRKVAG